MQVPGSTKRKATKEHLGQGNRKIVNKTDFKIQIKDPSATLGSRTLEQHSSFVFWTYEWATYRHIYIDSVEGNLALSSDDFYDDLSPVIEIHYEAKEKKLFFVFKSEDAVASNGDNDEHDKWGTKIWFFLAFLVCFLAWLTFNTTRFIT